MFAYGIEANQNGMARIMERAQRYYSNFLPYQPIAAYYCSKNNVLALEKLLDLISQRGGKLTSKILSSYIITLCKKGDVEKAFLYLHNRNFFSSLSKAGFSSLLKECTKIGDSETFQKVIQQVK